MITVGKAYSIPLTDTPQTLSLRHATANAFLLQPQETVMSYRLDGQEQAVCGFLLLEFETLSFQGDVVVWATDDPHGRVVVQEVKI